MANSAADIQKLYIAYFNRPADPGGLDYWMGSSMSIGQIANSFGAQVEYNAAFAGQPVELIIATLYQNLFGHQPDFGGLMYWVKEVNEGRSTIGNVAINIVSGATGADAVAINAKVVAATSFTAAIDTAPETISYLTPAGMNVAKAWLSSVTTDATAAAQIATQDATLLTIISTPSGVVKAMTMDQDAIMGTSGNDTITARIFDNSNTLQSGDKIDGGAGYDRLEADVGNSQNFAITPETVNVEVAAFRAQANPNDSQQNNLSEVQIDAQRMVGVNQWESNNSRADLIIEDVRILPTQITKDITIAMVETDPGHVDMGVYFDQYSLRAQTNSSNVLRLQLMDTRSAKDGLPPLKESPYKGFAFLFDNVLITVESPAIDAAQTYAELQVAIAAAVAAVPALAGVVVTIGDNFTVSDTLGTLQTGQEILLTSTSGKSISTSGAGTGWIANGAVPPSSGLHTFMSTVASSTTDLVTAKVILDDVGRGSTGGDLVIGGLSVGDTSGSQGVQRFEIEVRDNSKLEHISSTNNTLREVTFKNGVTTSLSHAYVETVKDKGNLTVNGTSGSNGVLHDAPFGKNTPLPGTVSTITGNQDGNYGFSDVRLLDGSAFAGKLAFTAEVTYHSFNKYLNLADIAADPAMDNVNFHYTGGANDDTMTVALDGGVMGSNTIIHAGREDVVFTADGGAGNDKITVTMVDSALSGNADVWYANQKMNANVFVNGGAGDDTIWTPGAGDVVITGGEGNDTIYADNTGTQNVIAVSPSGSLAVAASKGVFVFNTAGQNAPYVIGTNEERNLADLKSDANDSYKLYRGKLTVDFKGIAAKVDISTTDYFTSDLQINQAIKNAINKDAVLSKLLVATDGPANTLIVTSLIDGALATTDLVVTIAAPATGVLSATDIAGLGSAYNIASPTEALVLAAMATDVTAFGTKGDYETQAAETGAAGVTPDTAIVGAISASTSDNTITGGAGNDVIVFGTTVGIDGASAMDDSNDTVVYAGLFGNDTIVHFTVDATLFAGNDTLDFTALGGSGAQFGAAFTTNKSINVVGETIANDTIAEIKAFYTDSATTANKHVYVAVDGHNVGKVYSVVDGAAAGDLTVTLMGTIDLADTAWGSLLATNFA